MSADRDVAIAGATAVAIMCLIGSAGFHAGKVAAHRVETATLCKIEDADGDIAALGMDAHTGEAVVAYVYLPGTGEIVHVGERVPCRYLNRRAAT